MTNSAIEVSEILKTGTVVEIDITTQDGRAAGNYPGYVKQITEHDQIEIGLTAIVKQNFPLIKGQLVKIKITVPDGVYSFQGQTLECKEGFFTVGRPVQLELSEKRKHARSSIGIPVVFKMKGESLVFKGHTGNLSVGGMLLMTEKDLRVGDQLELQLILPKRVAGDSISGEVKRRMVIYLPKEEGQGYVLGVNFVQISDDEREAILSYLSAIKPDVP
jgi:c-di-GMP-binding flagellar brake protein YcgR